MEYSLFNPCHLFLEKKVTNAILEKDVFTIESCNLKYLIIILLLTLTSGSIFYLKYIHIKYY